MRITLLSSLLLLSAAANAIPRSQPASVANDDELEKFKNKHCKLISSVTYHDSLGDLFIENEYKCDLPPLRLRSQQQHGSPLAVNPYPYDNDPRPHNKKQQLPPTPPQQQKDERNIYLNLDKHQIISYGCAQISNPKALPAPEDKDSSLFFTLPLLTNQSCIPPGHLVEYKEVPWTWNTRWALTNYNRGEETICDWYQELAQVGRALNMYCEYSIERGDVDGQLGEVLAYGRDREREEKGGAQLWCLRYTKRGWNEPAWNEKCLGIGLEEENGKTEEEL